MSDSTQKQHPTPPNGGTQPSDFAAKSEPYLVKSSTLMGNSRSCWIEHRGERYRLQITKTEKLILTK